MDVILDSPKMDNPSTAVLFGPEGSGKSYIVAAIHHEWIAQKRAVRWMDCNQWPRDKFEAEKAMRQALSYRSLIVDDLGREPRETQHILSQMIMSFLNDLRGVFIATTNLKPVRSDIDLCELASTYGRAERSRMLQGHCLKVDGRDLRQPT